MAGELLPAWFCSEASFGFGGQESALKPPQTICKQLGIIKNNGNIRLI